MKIGFIGCGNMANAIISGILKKGIFTPNEIIVSDISKVGLENVKERLNINITTDNKEVVKKSEVIVLSIKPQYCAEVIKEIKDDIKENQIIVSIMAGQSISKLESLFERKLKIIRTMPNTPALVLEGMTGVCKNELVEEKELDYICKILSSFGKVEVINENLMDVVCSISGSSPAYVFMFIEAMADAGVLNGMPRDKAYKFASQAVYGSAKMVLETGKHPAELKDMVCSPAGTTIEAVRVLEEKGLRSSIIEAMNVCTEKSKLL